MKREAFRNGQEGMWMETVQATGVEQAHLEAVVILQYSWECARSVPGAG